VGLERDALGDIVELPRGARCPAIAEPEELAPPRGQVERQLPFRLVDPQPADALFGNS
jgi:hypothetical protein